MSVIARRLGAQRLAGPPARDPVDVVERILAVQGQDPRGARLAIRVRSRGLEAADVDRALSEDRTLVIAWLNRGTLHLVRSEDYPWLHALTTTPLHTGSARRLVEEGVGTDAAERGVVAIERALAEHGPLTREQLVEHVARAGVRSEGQAMYHLLFLTGLRGLTVRGPVVGGRHAYVLVRDWLGSPTPPATGLGRERALAELARRYLAGHGPAGERDLARWAGIGLRDVRAGLTAIARELVERDDGLLDLASRASEAPPPLPPPRLHGPFDPLLHGWVARDELLGPHGADVVTTGTAGASRWSRIFRSFALVDGRVAGTWTMPGGAVALASFEPLPDAVAAALREDAADVARFLGLPRAAM